MVFFDSIYKLQYYNTPAGMPCYCEQLVYANDMTFQIPIYTGSTSGFTVQFYVYSVDGLTQLETSTAYFDRYIFTYNGQKYLNARLKQFSPAMCANKCYIIRVLITANNITVFDGYSQQFCQNQCCDIPRGITQDSDGNDFQIPADQPTDEALPPDEPPSTTIDPNGMPVPPTSGCGDPIIRLITWADCLDAYGRFYGTPTNVLLGNATFAYKNITNLVGRAVQRPRDITRETSFNCRLQRAETATQYLLEGFEGFPTWKMDELEKGFTCNNIIIDDFISTPLSYQWDGGRMFEHVQNSNCLEIFRLNTTLRGCYRRVTYGCTPECTVANTGFIAIPAGFQRNYYSDSGLKVANDFESLLVWLNAIQGVTAEEVSTAGLPCSDSIYKLIELSGDGILPASIYYEAKIPEYRANLLRTDNINDVCSLFPQTGCDMVEFGTPVVTEFVIDPADFGTPIVTEVTPESITLTAASDWTAGAPFEALQYTGSAMVLNIDISTTLFNGADTYFNNVLFAYIAPEGRPSITQNIAIGSNLVSVGSNGEIRYTGQVTSGDGSSITLTLLSLMYNL
jgi:hypothetical protein